MTKLGSRFCMCLLSAALATFLATTTAAQGGKPKDTRPIAFSFMVDNDAIQVRLVGGEVTATMHGKPFPKERMRVTKGLVRFMDRDGKMAAEVTHWHGGVNLNLAPPKVRPWIGLALGDFIADAKMPVAEVAPQGPAAKAGIRAGDKITAIEGKPASAKQLQATLKNKKPGDSLELTVLPQGQTKERKIITKVAAEPRRGDPLAYADRQDRLGSARVQLEQALAAQLAAQRALGRRLGLKPRGRRAGGPRILGPRVKKPKPKGKKPQTQKEKDADLRERLRKLNEMRRQLEQEKKKSDR